MSQFFLTPEQSRIVQADPPHPMRHDIMDTVFRQADRLSHYGEVRVYTSDGELVMVMPSYEFRAKWASEFNNNPRRQSGSRRRQDPGSLVVGQRYAAPPPSGPGPLETAFFEVLEREGISRRGIRGDGEIWHQLDLVISRSSSIARDAERAAEISNEEYRREMSWEPSVGGGWRKLTERERRERQKPMPRATPKWLALEAALLQAGLVSRAVGFAGRGYKDSDLVLWTLTEDPDFVG